MTTEIVLFHGVNESHEFYENAGRKHVTIFQRPDGHWVAAYKPFTRQQRWLESEDWRNPQDAIRALNHEMGLRFEVRSDLEWQWANKAHTKMRLVAVEGESL